MSPEQADVVTGAAEAIQVSVIMGLIVVCLAAGIGIVNWIHR